MNETVLLLGDSIRLSYQPVVAEQLRSRAAVTGPVENCQFSLFTLASLPRWLPAQPPAVIHWNNGLHDVGHNPGRAPAQIPLEMYLANLDFIRHTLQATGARLIWATTTPVHERRGWSATDWSWRNEEIECYNHAARELMERHDVAVNDLHAVVAAGRDRFFMEDGVHLNPAGVAAAGAAVTAAIRAQLKP
jgi:lysophospholipase L1-like esterase